MGNVIVVQKVGYDAAVLRALDLDKNGWCWPAGVLTKAEAGRLPEAYAMYRRRDAGPNSKAAQAFRAAYSREATIRFIGVWDTVGALGIPLRGLSQLTAHRHEFHDVELSRYVQHGCHALAIDERRGPFRPSLWQAQPKPGQPTLEWMKERASYAGLALEETAASPTGRSAATERSRCIRQPGTATRATRPTRRQSWSST